MERKHFIMKWPELGKQVEVGPIEQNQGIYDWFLTNLPTKCLQLTTVVASQSLFMLNVPTTKECNWIQEESPVEDITTMNIGRFTFFMTTGNVANISVKFGYVSEPMKYVTWCEVIDRDKPILEEVGFEILDNIFVDKKIVHVEFVEE